MGYDTTQYTQQEGGKHETAGTFMAKVKVCKLGKSNSDEVQWLVGFQIGENIHFERFTMNESFGWRFDKCLKDAGLTYAERKDFEPPMLIGRQVRIKLETNDAGYLRMTNLEAIITKVNAEPVPF